MLNHTVLSGSCGQYLLAGILPGGSKLQDWASAQRDGAMRKPDRCMCSTWACC